MQRFLLVAVMFVLTAGFALAASPRASLRPVRQTHQRANRHHVHKATRHRAPRRHRHAV